MDRPDTIRYGIGSQWEWDRGNGARQLSTCIEAGVEIANKRAFGEWSFGIPFYNYGTTFLPFMDIKSGLRRKHMVAYAGYTIPMMMQEKENRWGYEIYLERISGCHSCYGGIILKKEMDGKVLHCDLSLRKEYNSYSRYSLGYYYENRETFTIKESYWHPVLTIKLSANRGTITQLLYFSVNQRQISEGMSFRLGLGIVFGIRAIGSQNFEILTMRSTHHPVSPY